MRSPSSRLGRQRSGNVLLAMVLAVMALAVLSLSVVQVTLASGDERRAAGRRLDAKLAAEAALVIVSDDLQRGGDGEVLPITAPWVLGAAEAFVRVEEVEADLFRLHAGGLCGPARVGLETVVRREVTPAFEHGAFGRDAVTLAGDVVVDSFDSSVSGYQALNGGVDGQPAIDGAQASVASLGNLQLEGSVQVFGDLLHASGTSALVLDDSVVHGEVSEQPAPGFLPESTYTASPAGEDWSLPPGQSATLDASDSKVGALVVGAESTLVVVGPGELTLSSLELEPGAQLVVDASAGPVTILVHGHVALDEGAVLASEQQQPSDVRLFCLEGESADGAGPLELGDDAQLHAAVVAPNAPIRLNSRSEVFGALSSVAIDLSGPFRLHHDRALSNVLDHAWIQLEQVGWRLREVPKS